MLLVDLVNQIVLLCVTLVLKPTNTLKKLILMILTVLVLLVTPLVLLVLDLLILNVNLVPKLLDSF